MPVSLFESQLSGGHPNSLGNTLEVVEAVLHDNSKLEELYLCYFSSDAVVRLRTSNAWKRIAKHDIQLFLPFLDRFINEIAKINQASTKWTLALLFEYSTPFMSDTQKRKAQEIIKHNLLNESDWIVKKTSMDTLGSWAQYDSKLKSWLIPHLQKLSKDPKKVVPKTAHKWLEILHS